MSRGIILPVLIGIVALGLIGFSQPVMSAVWDPITSGTTNDLYSIDCVDANTCYATGGLGTILKTADGDNDDIENKKQMKDQILPIDPNKLTKTRLPFIENQGQIPVEVKFYANTFSANVFVTEDSLTYSLFIDTTKEKEPDVNNSVLGWAIKERFVNSQTLNPKGLEKSGSIVNYFAGDSTNWKTNIPTFDTVTLGEIWDSIDVRLKVNGNSVEKIFYVNPGGNVEDIKISSFFITI